MLVGSVAAVMIAVYSCSDGTATGSAGGHGYYGHSYFGRGWSGGSGGSSVGSGTVRGGFGSTGHAVGT